MNRAQTYIQFGSIRLLYFPYRVLTSSSQKSGAFGWPTCTLNFRARQHPGSLLYSWINMDHVSGSTSVLVFTESQGKDDTLDKSLVSRLHKEEDDDDNSCLQHQPTKKMINFSNFTYDLLIDIAKWLKKLEDFTCFRSASKSLYVAVKDDYFKGLRLRQGTPYLMLPVRHDGTNDHVRELYSLVEGESTVASLKVPMLKKDTMCYESLGWLLAVQADGSMSLLDPLSNTKIPVPHPDAIPEYEEYTSTSEKRMFVKKMVLSSRPNETSGFILMVICADYSNLAFWRSGKKAWNLMVSLKGSFSDVVYDGGEQFYALNVQGTIWVINLAAGKVKSRIIIDREVDLRILCDIQNHYILKTIDGSLLCIKRTKEHNHYLTCKFDAYEIDTETGTWKVIDSLGSMAIFLGRNSSIAVDASKFPTTVGGVVKANHIYFTDDFWEFHNLYFAGGNWKAYCRNSKKAKGGCVDSGVYDFATKAIEPIYPVEPLLSNVCPAMWITPNVSF